MYKQKVIIIVILIFFLIFSAASDWTKSSRNFTVSTIYIVVLVSFPGHCRTSRNSLGMYILCKHSCDYLWVAFSDIESEIPATPLGEIERSCIPAMEVVDEQGSRRLKNSSFQETVL